MQELHGPQQTGGVNGCCMGKFREEGNCVTGKSTGTLGIKQAVVSRQCQAKEVQSDPLVRGEETF